MSIETCFKETRNPIYQSICKSGVPKKYTIKSLEKSKFSSPRTKAIIHFWKASEVRYLCIWLYASAYVWAKVFSLTWKAIHLHAHTATEDAKQKTKQRRRFSAISQIEIQHKYNKSHTKQHKVYTAASPLFLYWELFRGECLVMILW